MRWIVGIRTANEHGKALKYGKMNQLRKTLRSHILKPQVKRKIERETGSLKRESVYAHCVLQGCKFRKKPPGSERREATPETEQLPTVRRDTRNIPPSILHSAGLRP